MNNHDELVILVDEANNQIGTMPKSAVHTHDTPLHRAFSLFVFNSKKQLLVTRRAAGKLTFPGVWTNSVCGHPAPGESIEQAAKRRLMQELGIGSGDISIVSPYRYRVADASGIVENEICPVCTTVSDEEPNPVPDEVGEWKWVNWHEFLADIEIHPEKYSPWSREEALILQRKVPDLQ